MQRSPFIPLCKPVHGPIEDQAMTDALRCGVWRGDGPATRRAQSVIRLSTGAVAVFLTTSATHALEMAVRLAGIGPDDEVVMPSFTFVSTANAVVLLGARPVFADIRPDTLNLDPEDVGRLITPHTKAILPVHYAGTACDMGALTDLAVSRRIPLIEDAAQGVDAYWMGRALGTIGDFGAYSFHDTKNITCGEGGALLIRDPAMVTAAEILREKGTNRSAFLRGEVDRYTWMDVGSSYVPSDLLACLLEAQLSQRDRIRRGRAAAWSRYHEAFEPLEAAGYLRRQVVPGYATTNFHTYFITVEDPRQRDPLLDAFRKAGIGAAFHYIPLHNSPFGTTMQRTIRPLPVTERAAASLIRLPLYPDLLRDHPDAVERAVQVVRSHFTS